MKKIAYFHFYFLLFIFAFILPNTLYAAINITSATVNNASSVTVAPSATISARVNVTTTSGTNWRSTSWRIGSSGNYTCVNHANNNGSGSYTTTFNITAPTTGGVYDVSFIASTNDSCGGTRDSVTLASAIIIPTISISNASLTEGNSGNSNMNFTVTLSQSANASVSYTTSNGTATAGSDYTATSGTLNFTLGGQTTRTISVPIIGDTAVEPNETFTLTLFSPTNATLTTATAIGTIINDDISGYQCPNPKTFQIATTHNLNGNMRIIGNSNLCYNNNGTCSNPGNARNNDINMMYSDPDGATNPTTFNSSSALLSLPTNATIKWAKLYWQGYLVNKNDTVKTSSKSVLFAKAGSAYQSITPTSPGYEYNWIYFTGDRYYYQGSANVTALLQAGGNGYYNIANIVSEVGQPTGGSFGAWAIVIVYEDLAEPLKNITVFDGYQAVVTSGDQTAANNYASANGCAATGTGNTISIPLSGFLTPSSGAVNSQLGIFVGEGDKGATGERLKLTNKNNTSIDVYNGLNPADDVFNSTITYNGVTVTNSTSPIAITPYYSSNSMGIDIDTFNIGTSSTTTPIIGNSQTSTNVTLNTDGDGYMPGVFAFSTDIYAPNLFITKTPSSSSGGALNKGDQIDYTVFFKNNGKEIAKEILIWDDFTQNLLRKADGNATSPSVYLSDILDRNATKMLKSIRLSDVNSTSYWHCPQGLSGIPGCNVYDANCSVDYTGDPQTTATKVWCSLPRVDINASYTMKFSVNISLTPDTKNQEVLVENQIFALYKDNVTGISMPTSTSNSATMGSYNGIITTGAFDGWEYGLNHTNAKLYTKIANQNINFHIGKQDGTAFTGTVCAQLVSFSGTQLADYTCSSYANEISKNFSWFAVAEASKNNFINIKSTVSPNKTKADINATWTDSNSSDHFAIRPSKFSINVVGTPPNLLKAGEDYNLSIVAEDYFTNPTIGYNQTKTNLTIQNPPLKLLPNGIQDTGNILYGLFTFGATTYNFTNGYTDRMAINFTDVGKILIDINDSEWANIDMADTPEINRTIQGDINLTFIPYQFAVSGVRITNTRDGNFTYLSNDLNMSAHLDFNITAQNKQGNTTKNFSSGLYENNISIVPTIIDSTLEEEAIANNISSLNLGFNLGTKHISWNEANTSQNTSFNFARSMLPTNPFNIDNSEVNLLIESVYNDNGTSVTIENNISNQNGTTNGTTGNATFYYGRVNSPDYRFSGNNGNATIYYEVYAKDLNQTQRQALGLNGLQSINAIDWYQNTLHDALSDGNASYSSLSSGSYASTISPTLSLSIVDGQETLQLSNTNKPYVDKIQIIPSSWLTYPNTTTNFLVEFLGRGNWGGEGSVDRNASGNVGKITNENNITRSNKRLSW